tara:strand:+ start:175 stop:486 length:312 start_codon:yes stop_codon:yes gene_type:complete
METALCLSKFKPFAVAVAPESCLAENGGEQMSGVLFHSEFLHTAADNAGEEKHRREHFENIDLYQDYYYRLTGNLCLWCESSTQYTGRPQLDRLGLMSKGPWM